MVPVRVLRGRVAQIHEQRRACQFADVTTALPGLIRDLHTTLGTGRDHDELLELAVYLHVHVTRFFFIDGAGSADLLRRTVFLARRLAQQRDEVDSMGYVFGPVDAVVHRMGRALEAGEAGQAVSVAQQVNPERHPFPANRATYCASAAAHSPGYADAMTTPWRRCAGEAGWRSHRHGWVVPVGL
jgi:hypothetical protein